MKLNKTITFLIVLTLTVIIGVEMAKVSLAVTPTLTLTTNNDGDTIQLDVNGDANQSVVFYYSKTGANLQLSYLGKTDSNGSFSVSISSASYGISADSLVYVTVNNVKSNQVAWPYAAAANVLTLNQTGLALALGQSGTLTAYNTGTNFLYLSNNSNPPVANVYINGNQITVTAINYGSTVITVCAQASSPSCASAYITVQNTGAQPLVFSQSNITVANGQSLEVSVIGGSGSYLILNNSNPGAIQASLDSAKVKLTAVAASGSSSITVCTADVSTCGIINAAVGNANSTGITFSQTNPTMNIGQTLSITVSGGAGGNYNIFSNTNPSSVQANLSGDSLILNANASGSSVITVCSSLSSCGSVTATVSYTTSGGTIRLSQNNLWLLVGQTLSITISGGLSPYSVSGNYAGILQAKISDNILSITGSNAGSASVNVCSAGGGCTILAVLVQGTSSVTSLALSQNSLNLNVGQSFSVAITGNGGYSVSYNTSQNVASVTISGNYALVTALMAGNTNISICQNGGQCSVLAVTVANQVQTPATTWTVCAGENQTCSFSGSQTVRYGNGDKNYYGTFTGGVLCANSVFGDPSYGVIKQCGYGGVIPDNATIIQPTNTAGNWISCAGENQTCSFGGSQTVRYGNGDKYYYGNFTDGVLCANSIFGDPSYGVIKQCGYGGVIPANAMIISVPTSVPANETTVTATRTSCAGENQVCDFSGSQPVRYGSEGKYYYKTFIDGVLCANSVFGDPSYGVVKQCSYGGTVPSNATTGTPVKYKFSGTLVYGATGRDVLELQQRLKTLGYYNNIIDGKFLTSTVTAVKAYQQSQGIQQTGNVGPLTLATLNK